MTGDCVGSGRRESVRVEELKNSVGFEEYGGSVCAGWIEGGLIKGVEGKAL